MRASSSLPVVLVENPPVEVMVESFLDETPDFGYIPVLITLRNHRPESQNFYLRYTAGGLSGASRLQVDGNARSQTYVYVPIVSRGGVTLTLSGPGVRSGTIHLNSHWSSLQAYVGMGDRTAADYWVSVQQNLSSGGSSSSQLVGTKITPAGAPADWRAYTGFSSLWFNSAEWSDLDPGARAAILEWVGLGGNLYFLFENNNQRNALKIPDLVEVSGKSKDVEGRLGFGKIAFLKQKSNSVSAKRDFIRLISSTINTERPIIFKYPGNKNTMSHGHSYHSSIVNGDEETSASSWPLVDIVGELGRNVGILSLFMVIFAILIGPVNFFFFAPSRRRYRILWTTPLISIGASILLGLVILIGDGTGGQGARLTLACLLPEQKRLVVQQEQVSRTGLLLGKKFDYDDAALLQPVAIRSSSESNSYLRTDTGWAGDWFSSRAVQAHFAQTVRTARSSVRVTLPKDGKPGSVNASLDIALAELYVIAPDGAIYKASGLTPGVKRPLELVRTDEEYPEWWEKQTGAASSALKAAVKTSTGRHGWFYARAENPAELAQATLDSIRWTTDTAVITGPAGFEE
ncbi:MAG: hypothetical protein LBV54_03675 [Puniceicoccales bacterium]|nr:hypothetical protein [Puniceicoccales bacterium]